jgi:hypothetical protein
MPAMVGVLAAACGDSGSGFAGQYQMTSIETRQGCTGTPVADPITADNEFFELRDEEFLGFDVVGWHDCVAAGDCDEDSSGIYTKQGDRLVGGFTAWGGEPCSVTSFEETIEWVDDVTIRIVQTSRSGEVPELDPNCADRDSEEIEPYVEDLPCESDTTSTATAL